MVRQVLELMAPRSGGLYCDATLGTGGHALAILEASAPDGRLIGVDRDESAITIASSRLGAAAPERFEIRHGPFSDLSAILAGCGMSEVDGILLDLGLSSLQLEDPERGISFMRRGPLDMRMDRSSGATALELLRSTQVPELERILRELGEERWSSRIARAIHRAVVDGRLADTLDLASEVRSAVGRPRSGKVDSATRTFQALRIAVNGELDELRCIMERMTSLLAPGGTMVCISYHSLEDRIVKRALAAMARSGEGTILTPKPLGPDRAEIGRNRRSRSARMRAFRRAPAVDGAVRAPREGIS